MDTDRHEVTVECDRCRRARLPLQSIDGGDWRVGGQSGGHVWHVEIQPANSPDGRRRLSVGCTRSHRSERGRPIVVRRTVTQETLNAACNAAVAAGRRRISFADLRA